MKTQALLIFFILAAFACADDALVSVDATGGMITVQQGDALKSYRVKPFTEITINGQKASAAQLKAGMQVIIGLADPQTASKVTAKGNPGTAGNSTPSTTGATPKPLLDSATSSHLMRRIVFKGAVDAGDNLIIENGKLHIQHIDWSKPKDITINGIKWPPQWNGNTSDDFTAFNPPLATFAGAKVQVRKAKGRGEVTVLEPPTEANGQKLVVHLQDIGSGHSEFEVHITW
jgi:hypothetical protein